MTKPGNAASADAGSHDLMSIGEVLTRLRADFPDTTISKLRFLETEGLIEPRRTAAGYRKYSWSDLIRLRFILTAQRDHYLPLRIIREQLDAGMHEAPLRLVTPDERAGAEHLLTREELLARVPFGAEWLQDVEQHGLIHPRADGLYDHEVGELVDLIAQFTEYGLEPRHLRLFRVSVDRELSFFEQLTTPQARQRSPEGRARAAETLRELATLSVRLHTALLQARLRNASGE